MTREVTILADDLTGAADCAAAFAITGMETYVSFDDDTRGLAAATVLAVDTHSRWETSEAAYARTLSAARQALRAGSRVLYKKIDSTLRGHVGPEIAASFAAAIETADVLGSRPIVVLCPAFPATGRIVRGGRVLVDGTALDAVPAALLAAAGLAAVQVGVNADVSALAREIERRAGDGVDAVVCDAESDADLQAIAEAGARLTRPVLWAGSGGLARHLRSALGLGAHATAPTDASEWAPRRGPILILVGSPSDVAQGQATAMAREDDVTRVAVSPEALATGDAGPAWRDAATRIERSLAAGRDTCVVLVGGAAAAPTLDHTLARALGRLAAVPSPIGALVATGGDTARAALEARGIGRLRVRHEIEPGVPVCLTDPPRPMTVVTKAGGFGDAGALARARAALRSVPARSLAR
jgi:uncharacterized protein YgbK (DUF1537 family)